MMNVSYKLMNKMGERGDKFLVRSNNFKRAVIVEFDTFASMDLDSDFDVDQLIAKAAVYCNSMGWKRVHIRTEKDWPSNGEGSGRCVYYYAFNSQDVKTSWNQWGHFLMNSDTIVYYDDGCDDYNDYLGPW